MNCSPLIVDGQVDLKPLNADRFVLALTEAASKHGQLDLNCRYETTGDKNESSLRIQVMQSLKDLGKAAGFTTISASETSTSVPWSESIKVMGGPGRDKTQDEQVIENDEVRVFPICTPLSKFLYSDTDCIVEIFHPIDGRTAELSDRLKRFIREAVEQTKVESKNRLQFRVMSTEAGNERVEKLFSSRAAPEVPANADGHCGIFFESQRRNYRPSPALLLAQELGFREIGYSHSPGGGAPEKLIGLRVPTFNYQGWMVARNHSPDGSREGRH